MNQNTPQNIIKVSVVVPCYNGEPFVTEAIESVLRQGIDSLEVIYIDNCSTDSSMESANQCAHKDPRIRVLRNPSNLGLTGNWNRALSEARGQYVKLLCADDLLYPDILREQIDILDRHPEVAVVTSSSAIIDAHSKRIWNRRSPFPYSQSIPKHAVLKECIRRGTNVVGEPSLLLCRRAAVEKAERYTEEFKYLVDLNHTFGVLNHGDLWVTPSIGAGFRVHPGSLTNRTLELSEIELRSVFKRHGKELDHQEETHFKRHSQFMMKAKRLFIATAENPIGNRLLRFIAHFT